nr:hypothetical protein [Tanacetum cinerariifolium]
AATTASSLEAEQDSGNINKTQSKATPNESSSQGTDSGGGPRCQEAMRDTTAQTRVLDLEKTKTTKSNEIASLKRRVKKLEKRNKSITHKLKRLYKVGLTAMVESSDDEASLEQEVVKDVNENVVKEVDNAAQDKMFDRAFKRVSTFEEFRPELIERKEKRAREELIQESTKKPKVDDDKEKAELKHLKETVPDEEEVDIDAIPLVVKEDLEDLYKLVKARYGSTRPVYNMDYLLWSDMKLMFEPHIQDEVWKRQQGYKVLEWKLYDSCGVYSLRIQSMHIYMVVEKKYPLTPPTLSMMLERKIQIDYESKMAYQLCKLIKEQLKN